MTATSACSASSAPLTIAIDGPAGAGKSTVARRLAERLRIVYLDTGAMYRSLAWLALKRNIGLQNTEGLIDLLERQQIQVDATSKGARILCEGRDITSELYGPEVSRGSSQVAQHLEVRERLVAWQRSIAAQQSVILDGRDIGTQVLPQAGLKIFLTASPRERAERRFLEQPQSGLTLEEMEAELQARDERDSNRSIAPLRKAEDAVLIDSTGRVVDAVVNEILGLLQQRGLWKEE